MAEAMVRGMNFRWCNQSCGSTSRAFLHEAVADRVLNRAAELCRDIVPGNPVDLDTRMGALISAEHGDRGEAHVEEARRDSARIVVRGRRPQESGSTAGFIYNATIADGLSADMRIVQEAIFGPVLCVRRRRDEDELYTEVNGVGTHVQRREADLHRPREVARGAALLHPDQDRQRHGVIRRPAASIPG
ncbi:acyl-CoA reductase-like NAD-dependent aldehyde dehydrogenase [Amorphus sp. MBR-141]